jgi:hypothetical protein
MTEPGNDPRKPTPLAALLELVALQLEVAMQNSAAQAALLSESVAEFCSIAARLRAMRNPALITVADDLQREAHRAVTAMQFHDQLAQRVMHVRDALGDAHDGLLAGDVHDWSELLRKMRSHYSMEDERRLFDLVLGALPGAVKQESRDEALAGSVELF